MKFSSFLAFEDRLLCLFAFDLIIEEDILLELVVVALLLIELVEFVLLFAKYIGFCCLCLIACWFLVATSMYSLRATYKN